MYYGTTYLPVLMSSTRIAYQIMLHAHKLDHSGRDTTYEQSAHIAWIVGHRVLTGKVKSSCVKCRYLKRKLEGQRMFKFPRELTVPSAVDILPRTSFSPGKNTK